MISVTLMVKNGEKHLADCLESLKPFDEVLLVDTGSTDRTLEIARTFENVKIVEHDFIGFGPTKNRAAGLARNDWILNIDSDEVLTAELTRALLALEPSPNAVGRFPRQSYYNGKWIRGCGWYPDKIIRLYNKTHTAFNDNLVHESIRVKPGMAVTDLEWPVKHYPYDSAASLVDKFQFYSTLYADQNKGKIRSSPLKAVTRGGAAFFKGYFLRRGFAEGYEGFLIALCQGLSTYFKYIKLHEANKNAH